MHLDLEASAASFTFAWIEWLLGAQAGTAPLTLANSEIGLDEEVVDADGVSAMGGEGPSGIPTWSARTEAVTMCGTATVTDRP